MRKCERAGNPPVTGSSNTNELLSPSLAKRGEGRFYQHFFKIPLYPPFPKGDKNNHHRGITRAEGLFLTFFLILIEWHQKGGDWR
ncbi:MAG: hypothetical protein A2V86_10310 [Deltaproteobacteria bacterium RBG_16_49_23]|nr:MAG: hypothetical protein A2V86_10310 [Deltaproteobacteria bacterium RBG_16_49_23]